MDIQCMKRECMHACTDYDLLIMYKCVKFCEINIHSFSRAMIILKSTRARREDQQLVASFWTSPCISNGVSGCSQFVVAYRLVLETIGSGGFQDGDFLKKVNETSAKCRASSVKQSRPEACGRRLRRGGSWKIRKKFPGFSISPNIHSSI